MPLLDHFHSPIHPLHHWDAFHSNWATRIADLLNDHWLPPEFLAQETTHSGGQLEIDIATYHQPDAGLDGNSTVTTARRAWSPSEALRTMPIELPDVYEVRVFSNTGGATLVGAIELIGPANKDRHAARRAFAVKCAGLLYQGVSVVIVDIVTSRHANLHNETLEMMEADPGLRMPDEAHLYAAAYRPVWRDNQAQMEMWTEHCALGASLPTMPLRLTGDLFVPVEFEASYQEASRRRRLGAARK